MDEKDNLGHNKDQEESIELYFLAPDIEFYQLTGVVGVIHHGLRRAGKVEDHELGVMTPRDDGLVQLDGGVHATNVIILPVIIRHPHHHDQ